MYINQFLKYFFMIFSLIFFTACSNKTTKNSTTIVQATKPSPQQAQQEIIFFVNPDKNVSAPSVETYKNAGIKGVTKDNIDEINTFISKKKLSDIDSTKKLQSFVDSLVQKLTMSKVEKNAINNITKSLENNTSLSLKDFKDANIVGVTSENLKKVQNILSSISKDKRDTKLEIQALIDFVPPIITIVGETSMQILQNNPYIDLGATAIDEVDGNVSVISSGEVNTAVLGIYNIKYTAIDKAGNKATASRIVRVISLDNLDIKAPLIEIQGSNTFNIALGEKYVDAGAIAIDDVDKNVSISTINQVNTSILGTYKVLYFAKDKAGNEANASRVVNVISPNLIDREKPIIKINGKNPIEILLNTVYEDAGASVSDNVDNNLIAKVTSNVNTSTLGTYSVVYNAIDNSGNKATATRTVKVVSQIIKDNIKPKLTLKGSANITLPYKGKYTDYGALFTDNIDKDRIVYSNVSVDTSKLQKNTIIPYNATDKAGNLADMIIRTVNVVDNESPVITLLGDINMTIAQGSTYSDQGTTASDNYDASINVLVNGGVNTATLGTYTLTYTATDKAGNTAIPQRRTVTVADLTPAIIILNGKSEYNVSQGGTYIEQGARAIDVIDGNNSANVSGNVDTSKVGDYILRYNYTDKAGNPSNEVNRTIHVVDDTKPIITLNGDANITLLFGDTYIDANATFSDNVDANRTITTSDTVNTSALGTYILHYNATDKAGNVAKEVLRTVTVGDTVNPVITLNGAKVITLTAGDPYVELNATATDNVAVTDMNITITKDNTTVVNKVDTRVSVNTTYDLVYAARDFSGNTAYTSRTVYVELNKAPIANAGLDQNLTEGAYIDLNASGSSDSDGNITQYYWKEGSTLLYQGTNPIITLDPLSIGVHTLTLTVTDNNHTMSGQEKNATDILIVDISIGTSNVKYANSNTTIANYDDEYYKAGIDSNYTRDNITNIVTDNITGLKWQDDNLSSFVRAVDSSSYCSSLTLASLTWRVPSREELSNIIDYRRSSLAIDSNFTSGFLDYWTSTGSVSNTANSWYVHFIDGLIATSPKSDYATKHYVKCVTGTVSANPTFDRNITTGTITDNKTTLEWQDDYSDNGNTTKSGTWQEALTYCHDLNLSKIKGIIWRLPNQRELLSIVDDTKANPSINAIFTKTSSVIYWSSSILSSNHSNAWDVDFSTGWGLNNAITEIHSIRCVRTGRAGRAGPYGNNN